MLGRLQRTEKALGLATSSTTTLVNQSSQLAAPAAFLEHDSTPQQDDIDSDSESDSEYEASSSIADAGKVSQQQSRVSRLNLSLAIGNTGEASPAVQAPRELSPSPVSHPLETTTLAAAQQDQADASTADLTSCSLTADHDDVDVVVTASFEENELAMAAQQQEKDAAASASQIMQSDATAANLTEQATVGEIDQPLNPAAFAASADLPEPPVSSTTDPNNQTAAAAVSLCDQSAACTDVNEPSGASTSGQKMQTMMDYVTTVSSLPQSSTSGTDVQQTAVSLASVANPTEASFTGLADQRQASSSGREELQLDYTDYISAAPSPRQAISTAADYAGHPCPSAPGMQTELVARTNAFSEPRDKVARGNDMHDDAGQTVKLGSSSYDCEESDRSPTASVMLRLKKHFRLPVRFRPTNNRFL